VGKILEIHLQILRKDKRVPDAVLKELQRLARDGHLVDQAAIERAISLEDENDDETEDPQSQGL
jgi:hypothetical protein